MAVRLPQSSEDSLMFIVQMAAKNRLVGISYNVGKTSSGLHVLKSIELRMVDNFIIEKPPAVVIPGGLVKMPGG